MHEAICILCRNDGTFEFSLVVQCQSQPVRFQAIYSLTPLELTPGVPVHGEVCPGDWIFHRLAVPDTQESHDAGGVRFNIHVHTGDIYYAMSRWDRMPGFTACNDNTIEMQGQHDGAVDLCHLAERFRAHGSTGHSEDHADPSELLSDVVELGYIGLYGGTSCAYYTVEATYLRTANDCSTERIGSCPSYGGGLNSR